MPRNTKSVAYRVHEQIQTILAGRLLPNASQCSYTDCVAAACKLLQQWHSEDLQIIEETQRILAQFPASR